MFDDLIGQARVRDLLSSMLAVDRTPHALLFAGPNGVGKTEAALETARRLLCHEGAAADCGQCLSCRRAARLEHPDLHVLFPTRRPSSDYESWLAQVQDVRSRLAGDAYAPVMFDRSLHIVRPLANEVHDRLMAGSLEGGRKVCIILHADRMNDATGNSLLKILEEPPEGVHFIMTTERVSSVLATIVSRSSVVRFRRLTEPEIADYIHKKRGIEPSRAGMLAAQADGSLKNARSLADGDDAGLFGQAAELYGTLARGGRAEVLEGVAAFSWSRDVAGAESLIHGFALCTRQVLEHMTGLDTGPGSPAGGIIAELASTADLASIRTLARTLEDGLEMLGRNVNVSTVMTTLFYEITEAYG